MQEASSRDAAGGVSPDQSGLRGAPSSLLTDLTVAAGAFVVEALLMGLGARYQIAVGWLVVVHVAVIASLANYLRLRMSAGSDATAPLLLLTATAVTGPLGALGALIAMPALRLPSRSSPLLDAWYERLAMSTAVDGATHLSDDVRSGRTIGARVPAPPSLETVMLHGSLIERQTALGLIARKFHPDYAPALHAALRSQEPVVRVQAAAVAARVRGNLKRRLAAALAAAPQAAADPDAALATIVELKGLQATGLIDEGDRKRIAAASQPLSGAIANARTLPAITSTIAQRTIEAELIAAGRFAELRALRKVRRLSGSGLFRVRTMAARRAPGTHDRAGAGAP